jgi:DNA-binding CsgD family transcriptional regulator
MDTPQKKSGEALDAEETKRLEKSHTEKLFGRDIYNSFVENHPGTAETEARLGLRFSTLSLIEIRICVLSKAGKNSREIGDILRIEEQTVNNHRTYIRSEIGMKHRENFERFLRPY